MHLEKGAVGPSGNGILFLVRISLQMREIQVKLHAASSLDRLNLFTSIVEISSEKDELPIWIID